MNFGSARGWTKRQCPPVPQINPHASSFAPSRDTNRGLIHEATRLVESVGADLWILQGRTRGPFADISRIPATLEDRVRAVPGVAQARRFVSHASC